VENFDWITGALIPYLNLSLFLFLAFKIFKGPLLGALSIRRDDYVQQLAEANRVKDEAEAKHKELSEKLAKLSREVESIKDKAKLQAEAEASKIIAEAEALAQHLKAEAQKIASAELEKAKAGLRHEIISGVRENVVSRIQAELSGEKQKSIFNAQLSSLKHVSERA